MTVRPTARRTDALLLAAALAVAAVTFLTGLTWGLPSSAADPFLFGGRRPWTGAEVMRLAGPWQPAGDRGSDRPQHAVGPPTGATVLNATDADRAEIVRRYRLYSCQPDEMITFRALSRMRPGSLDLDPRLYQYGGLWIYPVGGLLRLAAAAHLLTLRTDLAFYLDHPAAFGRFYVVARLYSAAWGLAGVGVVYGLARESGGRRLVAATAAATYACLPVVVNAAHEAKPHLAGTVLTLATVWAAARAARTGRGWTWPAVSAGAASGMVLTGVAAWAVLPLLAWRRPRRLLVLLAVAACVYVATNPFVPLDLLLHRERLVSNVGNSVGFYGPSLAPATLANAARLVWLGTSTGPLILALAGGVLFAARRPAEPGRVGPGRAGPAPVSLGGPPRVGWLLAAPATFVAVQFALLARGKPAEYARFALTLDVALTITAATMIPRLPLRPREAALAGLLLVAAAALYALPYDLNALADRRPTSTRLDAARRLAGLASPGRPLVVAADPAPYGLPPVDLFAWQITLVPTGEPGPPGGLRVEPTDTVTTGPSSPISWADKPFRIVPTPARR